MKFEPESAEMMNRFNSEKGKTSKIENICLIHIEVEINKKKVEATIVLIKKRTWFAVKVNHKIKSYEHNSCVFCKKNMIIVDNCTFLTEHKEDLFDKIKKNNKVRLQLVVN